MKKKFPSVLSFFLCLTMNIGAFAGCKGGDDTSKQDAMAQKVLEVLYDNSSYTGAFTVHQSNTIESETVLPDAGEERYVQEESYKCTVDPAAKRYASVFTSSKTESDQSVSIETRQEKVFQEENKYYNYNLSTDSSNPAEDSESYAEVSSFMATVITNNERLGNPLGYNFMAMRIPHEGVTSITDYNAAWASYIADSKAEIVAGSTNEESQWYGYSVQEASYVVSAAEVDGGYALTVKMSYNMTDCLGGTRRVSLESVFTAKDGKIVSVLDKEDTLNKFYMAKQGAIWQSVDKDTEGAQVYESSYTREMFQTISYQFTQADFDSITTTVPANVQKQDDRAEKNIDVVINGIQYENQYVQGNTVEEALVDALPIMAEGYIGNSTYVDIVWYTDTACTQAIDASTMTLEQLYALDTLYAKATAKEGYVLYTRETVRAFTTDVPESYRVALEGTSAFASTKRVYVCKVSEGIRLHKREENYVNGAAVDSETMPIYPVVEGQTYEVKEVLTVNKADLNFFTMEHFINL